MNLDFRNTNSLWCSVLAETLHRCGVRHAIVSPGSRSTPLVFALASHPAIEAVPVLDERSAAFFALGLSKQNSRAQAQPAPVALVCTSGTAAANFFPAIIEAQESGVPLVVITADRPPEMRECGSGQTIDQQKLYGSHVNWHHELAVPKASLERLRYLRQTVAHACERATIPGCGPVHLNAPFRDPLSPVADGSAGHLREKIDARFFEFLRHDRSRDAGWARGIAGNLAGHEHKRGVIVAGPGAHGCHLPALAAKWPVLADALSDARHSAGENEKTPIISAYDAILRNERLARELAPELVLCIGGWPVSKVLRAWIEKHDPEIFMAGNLPKNSDALHGRTRWLGGGSGTGCHPVSETRGLAMHATEAHPTEYLNTWRHAEATARAALDKSLGSIDGTDLFEPRAAWLLAKHLPEKTPVFVANSMPVRDAESFWPASNRGIRFFYNRGANGIDGTLSTALGVAHGNAQPAVLLTGDLSLLHDTNGLLLARRTRGGLTIVLVNNNGGGIFEHLLVAKFDPPFEEFFATPQDVDFAKLCVTYGVQHTLVKSWGQFAELIAELPAQGVRVLEIRTDRKRDTARRRELLTAAANAARA